MTGRYSNQLNYHTVLVKESASFPKAIAKVECFFELAKHSEEKILKFVQIKGISLFLQDRKEVYSDVSEGYRHSAACVEVY